MSTLFRLCFILVALFRHVLSTASVPATVMEDNHWMSDKINTNQVIKIGTALTLDYTTKYGSMGRTVHRAYKLYFDWLNRVHGGIKLQGSVFPVQLTIIDDQSNGDKVEEITEWLVTKQNVSHLLAPYGSALTGRAAKVAHDHGAVMVAPCASNPSVFLNRPRIFGTNSKSSLFLEEALKAVSLQSAYRTITYLQEDLGFTKGVCATIAPLAVKNDMKVSLGVTVSDDAPEDEVREKLAELQAAEERPDILIGCVYENVCHRLLRAARQLGYNPNAIILTICVTSEDFLSTARDNGAFIMGVAPWVRTLQFKSALTEITVPEFVHEFETTYPRTYTPYQAASAFSAAAAMVRAIETAGTLDPEAVATQLSRMDELSVLGRIFFDENGQNTNDFKTVQTQLHLDTTDKLVVVAPSDAANGQMKYPKPTWDAMACLNRNEWIPGRFGEAADGSCVACAESEIAPFNATLGVRVCKSMNCPEGKYSVIFDDEGDRRGGAYCADCHRGYFAEGRGASMCSSCPAGSYQDQTGQTACVPCSPGRYADMEGSTECVKCGELEPEYASGYNNFRCQPCITGALCLPDAHGLYTNFTNDDGYYSIMPEGGSSVDIELYKCVHGNEGSACKAGGECSRDPDTGEFVAEGPFCGVCRPGFGRAGIYDECEKCPSQFMIWFSSIFNGLMVFVIAQLIFLFVIYTDFTRPKNIQAIIMKQVLNYMGMAQMVFAVVELRLPEGFNVLPKVLSLILGHSSMTFAVHAAHCLSGQLSNNNHRYEVYVKVSLIWIPGWILFLCVMFYISWRFSHLLHSYHKARPIHKSRLITLLIVNLFVIHTRNTSLSLLVLICHRFEEPRLLMHSALLCNESTVMQWKTLGVLSFVLFSLGIPLGMYLLLRHYKNHDALFSRKVVNSVGFLYSGFEAEHYYFEVIFMIRKVLYQVIVLVPGLTGADDEKSERTISCMCMLVLAVVFLATHMSCEPFDNRSYKTLDRIEAASLWAILVTLLLETWRLISDKARAFSAEQGSETFRDIRDWVCTIIIVFFHVRFFVLTIYLAFRDRLQKFFRCRKDDQDIVICTIDGVKVKNPTTRGRDLFATMFGELADLLIDSSGRVNYQDFTESVQYMCVDCRYHRIRDKLPTGAACEDSDETALALAVNKTLKSMYAWHLFDYFVLDPLRRFFNLVSHSAQRVNKRTGDLLDFMNMSFRDRPLGRKQEWEDSARQMLENLENLKKFNRENVQACVGMVFRIDELHMSMVRLQRELRGRTFLLSPKAPQEEEKEGEGDTFGFSPSMAALGGFFRRSETGHSGESLKDRVGHLIGLNATMSTTNLGSSPASTPKNRQRRNSGSDPGIDPDAEYPGATPAPGPEELTGQAPAERRGSKRGSTAVNDAGGLESPRVDQEPSSFDRRASLKNANAAFDRQGSVKKIGTTQSNQRQSLDFGAALTKMKPVGSMESQSAHWSPNYSAERFQLAQLHQLRNMQIEEGEQDSESFARKLAIAVNNRERETSVDRRFTSGIEGPKLKDIVNDLKEVKRQIEQMNSDHQMELERRDAEIKAINDETQQLRERLQNAQGGAVLTMLHNMSVESSDEEEEDSKSQSDLECKGCGEIAKPDHKYCIHCGRNRALQVVPGEEARLALENEIAQTAQRQEELQDELYRLKVQLETATAVEEHQGTLLEGADKELEAANKALATQVLEVRRAEQEVLNLRMDADQKARKLQGTEERIAAVRAEIRRCDESAELQRNPDLTYV